MSWRSGALVGGTPLVAVSALLGAVGSAAAPARGKTVYVGSDSAFVPAERARGRSGGTIVLLPRL